MFEDVVLHMFLLWGVAVFSVAIIVRGNGVCCCLEQFLDVDHFMLHREAHRYAETGRPSGKVVMQVQPST